MKLKLNSNFIFAAASLAMFFSFLVMAFCIFFLEVTPLVIEVVFFSLLIFLGSCSTNFIAFLLIRSDLFTETGDKS